MQLAPITRSQTLLQQRNHVGLLRITYPIVTFHLYVFLYTTYASVITLFRVPWNKISHDLQCIFQDENNMSCLKIQTLYTELNPSRRSILTKVSS